MGNTTLNPVLYAKVLGASGGSTTPESVVNATSNMTPQQEADTLDNIGGEPKKFVITVTYDDVNDEYTADKTYDETVAAYNAGKTLVVKEPTNDSIAYLGTYDGSQFTFFTARYDDSYGLDALSATFYLLDYGETWAVFHDIIFVPAPTTVTDTSSTSITLAPQANTEYQYGELTSLTISNPPATGAYSIVFTSGSTATTTTIPATILGLESFAAEANTLYEINVLDNRAVVGSWAVSA